MKFLAALSFMAAGVCAVTVLAALHAVSEPQNEIKLANFLAGVIVGALLAVFIQLGVWAM